MTGQLADRRKAARKGWPMLLMATALAAAALAGTGRANAQAPDSPQPETSTRTQPGPTADQHIRCRWVDVSGSLFRRVRACKTEAEWRRLQDAGNGVARQLLENGSVRSGN